ncbi:MAG TPA: YciI family protein [Acidisarcina sp.]
MTEETSPTERQARNRDIPRNLRQYFLGFLIKGQRWNDPAGSEDLQALQLAFLREQIEAGTYIVAGPVTDGGDMVGVAIISAGSLEEAKAIIGGDPGIHAGRLAADVRPAFLPSLSGVKVEF